MSKAVKCPRLIRRCCQHTTPTLKW